MSLTVNVVGGTFNTQPETITPGSFAIGLNVSGMEYGGAGAVANYNYVVPTLSELQYYHAQGQDLIRLPISWTTLQPTLNGPLDATYLANIESVVSNAASLGMKVIIDLHDYGAYNGNDIGGGTVTDADFANFWKQLAGALAGKPGLGGYDLMNEPNNMPSATAWTSAAQAAITSIRTVDMSTPIYVEGNHWANSYDWSQVNPGFTMLSDPANNLIFEAHVYLDSNDSGTNFDWAQQASQGVTTETGVQRLQDFVTWLQDNHLKGMVGEVGVGNNNSDWLTALDNTLAYAKANNLETTYWAAGSWWGNYPMSVEPQGGVNAPQMAVLDKYSGNYPAVSVAALTGTAASGSTVYLSENDVLLATTTANSAGDWSYTLTGLSNGVHVIVAGDTPPGVDGTISATVFNYAASQQGDPLCFTPGTRILTPLGEIAVEKLKIGDKVRTLHGGDQKIKWIGRSDYAGQFIKGHVLRLPVCIAKDAIADGVPARDLTVSPGHGIYIDGVLVPAWRLVNGVSITQAQSVESVTYIHLELDEHEILLSEGCPTESFLDIGNRHQFHNAPQPSGHAEYTGEKYGCAPRAEDGFLLQTIQHRLMRRAGLAITREYPGPLRGYVDVVGPDWVQGWAQCVAAPETPVTMDVLAGGRRVTRVLANLYRPDLREAGLGSGCCAFSARLPAGLSGKIEVRRASDQALLPETPQPVALAG